VESQKCRKQQAFRNFISKKVGWALFCKGECFQIVDNAELHRAALPTAHGLVRIFLNGLFLSQEDSFAVIHA